MGTNIDAITLIITKNKMLDDMIRDIKKWDGKVDSGIQIIDHNQEILLEIEDINKSIDLLSGTSIDQREYYSKIEELFGQLKEMTKRMDEAKKSIIEEKRILSKKEDLIDNYINNSKESVFIDKDI